METEGEGGSRVPRPRCSNDFFLPIGLLALALAQAHMQPWPLASCQGVSGVTTQPVAISTLESHCSSAPLPHLLLSTTHVGWGPNSYSLVIEVICAKVVMEFIHDLVVVHDLRNLLLQGQVVMRTHVCPGGWGWCDWDQGGWALGRGCNLRERGGLGWGWGEA